jgi:phage tail-like protein
MSNTIRTRPQPDSDPASTLWFEVKVDGTHVGEFSRCEGLGAEYELLEYAEGGVNDYTHRIPTRLKYGVIKLSRPLDAQSGELAAWFARHRIAPNRKQERHTGSITAYDASGASIATWQLVGVAPLRWSGPTFALDGGSVAVETLELVHDGFLR